LTLYIETSAVLSWLFGENKAYQVQKGIEHAELVVTSRSISRVLFQKLIKESQSKQLKNLFTDTVSIFQRHFNAWNYMKNFKY